MITAVTNELQAAALDYISRGFSVIPLCWPNPDGTCGCGRNHEEKNVGKVPLTQHGLKDATTTQLGVNDYWGKWPNANIGIVIPDGYFVPDIDAAHGGFISLEMMQANYQKLPSTWTTFTGGGGAHFWYKGEGVRNTVALAGYPGIDLRGLGGYVVGAPSLHRSGNFYVCNNTPIAEAPEWLVDLCTQKRPQLTGAATDNEPIPEGQRNHTLASLAGTMRRRGMTEESILAALKAENLARCKPPLPEDEVETIAKSVSRYHPEYGYINTYINSIPSKDRVESESEQLPEQLGTTSPKEWGKLALRFDEIMRGAGGGWQDKKDLAEQLGTTSSDRAFRSLLQRRREDGKVRVHNSRPNLIQWVNREYKVTQLDGGEKQTFLNIKLPLKMHELVRIPPGSIIGIAGYTSAGKTSFLLELAELNVLTQSMPVYYWYNEMSQDRMINRCVDFPLLYEAQKQNKFFPVKQGDFEFHDVLEPDAINLVDYLDRDADLFLIGQDIKQLQVPLSTGVVVFALQKPADRAFGYGGLPSAKLSNLYVSLDKKSQTEIAMIGQAEIIKAKDWLNGNPVGLKCSYHTGGKFGKLFIDGTWQRSK